MISILDVTGQHIGSILTAAAAKHIIPTVLLLACGIAESGLDPHAYRDGSALAKDKSAGPYQQSIYYCAGYGIGDNTDSPANVALCKASFADWGVASDIAAQHLAGDLSVVRSGVDLSMVGGDELLAALVRYNYGHYPSDPGDIYWTKYTANIAAYGRALATAHEQLGE